MPNRIQRFKAMSSTANTKASRTRRQRGYVWEDSISKRFNGVDGWSAFRLGSPSISLPDILAVNTAESILYVIEAKSSTTQSLYVPAKQIHRCAQWLDIFDIYQTRAVILAFKFGAKRRTGTGTYEGRKLKEYFKIWRSDLPPADCTCRYDGTVKLRSDGIIPLRDCSMPFPVRC